MHKFSFLGVIFVLSTLSANTTRNIETRVINGTQVQSNNTQWQSIVSLRWEGSQYCGGTLIAPNWVLTAAHCLTDSKGVAYGVTSEDLVGAGSYSLSMATEYSIKQFVVHPSYNPITLDYDIALIELNSHITDISPIAVDISNPLSTNTQTEVAGWGNMTTTGENFPNNLMEAVVPIVDFNACSNAYSGNITYNMICAGYLEGGNDSCQGDSGGPLIAWNNNQWEQVGIVSWGDECAAPGYPGVYTKVQNFSSWIQSYTGYSSSTSTSSSSNSSSSSIPSEDTGSYEKGFDDGILFCQEDPGSCGINTTSSSWSSQSDINDVINQTKYATFSTSGYYLHYGDSRFDWLYLDTSGNYVFKLEKGCSENGELRWSTIHTPGNQKYNNIQISNEGKSISFE